MESGKKRVIGGRLVEMFEGELKLVFQNGVLQKSHEHRHSCAGKVALITMEVGINAGAVLACEHCHWRTSFDPLLLMVDNREALLHKIFGRNPLTFYCSNCGVKPISFTKEEKCADCLTKEAVHVDLPDDLKK